jgi:geranylgeranyl diphosphate synthase type II
MLDIIAIISDAAGINGMVEGQIMDMQSESTSCSNIEYLKEMHKLKTGKMIMASVATGAVSVGAEKEKIDALLTYAEKTGLAFQVTDDILNIEGNPKIMGKATGSDAANHKLTFPGLIGLEESKKYADKLIKEAIRALEQFDTDARPLYAIGEYILKRNR